MNQIYVRIQVFWDVMLCCWVKGSRSFVAQGLLRLLDPWRWRHYVLLRCHKPHIKWHLVKSQRPKSSVTLLSKYQISRTYINLQSGHWNSMYWNTIWLDRVAQKTLHTIHNKLSEIYQHSTYIYYQKCSKCLSSTVQQCLSLYGTPVNMVLLLVTSSVKWLCTTLHM